MRRLIAAALAGLFALSLTVAAGCSDKKKTEIPDKQIDVPKNDPIPSSGGGGKGGKQTLGTGAPPSSAQ
jgi:hypothetical protein